MTVVVDKSLTFDFPSGFEVVKWDDGEAHERMSQAWQFACACSECPSHTCTKKSRKTSSCPRHSSCKVGRREGLKAVDLVCLEGDRLYLVEVKDFNASSKADPPDFTQDHILSHYVVAVAKKFRDSIFSLFCCSFQRPPDACAETAFSGRLRAAAKELVFVFHFESPKVAYKTSLYPSGNAVSLVQMKAALAAYLGADLVRWLQVVDCSLLKSDPTRLPWTVRRQGGRSVRRQ